MVLIGFQGSGKSATGNSILKAKRFRSGMGTIGSTTVVETAEMIYDHHKVTIVDTPPLSSTQSFTSIIKSLSKQQQTTAVYAIVITIGRITGAEKNVIGGILSKFQNIMRDRTLFIFTREKELPSLDSHEMNKLEKWLDPTPIQKWIDKYNIPYFAIENTTKDLNTDTIMNAAVIRCHQNAKVSEYIPICSNSNTHN